MRLPTGVGPHNAAIMLVGETWGEADERYGESLLGAAGAELNQMLQQAGIRRGECYATSVVNARPYQNNVDNWIPERKSGIQSDFIPLKGKMVAPIVLNGYNQLLKEIEMVNPTTVIAFGGLALWALTGAEGITKWRGSQLTMRDGRKVLPTLHPTSIFRQMEMRPTVVSDLRRAARDKHSRTWTNAPDWHFLVRPSFASVMDTLGHLKARLDKEQVWIDFDLETRAGHIACAGLSWSLLDSICIPLMCVESADGYWLEEQEFFILCKLRDILCHRNALVRGQNLIYDCQYTWKHWRFVPRVMQDTLVSFHTLFASLPKRLDYQASILCDHYVYWKDDGKTWTQDVGEDQLWSYNCQDCVRTREVGEVELTLVKQYGLEQVDSFQQQMFWPVLYAMIRGVRIDHGVKHKMCRQLEASLVEHQAWLERILGHELNIRSPKQLSDLFYVQFGQPPVMSRGSKHSESHLTTNSEALELIGMREPILAPICRTIEQMRSLGVFLSTFAEAEVSDDGRMRCSYHLGGAKTYRFSSSKDAFGSGLNLQNVPIGDEDYLLPNVRAMFIPDDGMEMFDTDLSKADLRIVVYEADEREMKAMLAEGRDPYMEVCREFYHDPSISKTLPNGATDPRYKMFKSFCHGTHYLGTARGLAQRLGLLVHEAERTQAWYFGKFPAIARYQIDFKKRVSSTRQVTNKFGYRMNLLGRVDDSAFREAIAWIPQSTVAILINKIWMNIYKNTQDIEVLLQVHDSLVGQYPIAEREKHLAAIRLASHVVIPYDDPLIIPIGVKTSQKSWGDCE